jgi:predicted phage terminase large subunit-like protein
MMVRRIIQSWDTAIKAAAHHDASACATFAYDGTVHQLMDMQVMRLEYPELKRAMIAAAERYAPEAILIEDKASGQSLLQDLRRETTLPLIANQPRGDKILRVARITPLLEAGNVALPTYAPWLAAFEQEVALFPHGAHDDQIDAMTQYLLWAQAHDSGGRYYVRGL